MVSVGAIVFFPRAPVETANPGSPMGTLALSSQQTTIYRSPSSTAFCLKYLNKIAHSAGLDGRCAAVCSRFCTAH